MTTLSEMFLSGNILFMSVLTILFALTFLATWKAPAWVRNVGRIAASFGLFFGLLGLTNIWLFAAGWRCRSSRSLRGLQVRHHSRSLRFCHLHRLPHPRHL